MHTTGNETIAGVKTFTSNIVQSGESLSITKSNNTGLIRLCGGSEASHTAGAKLVLAGSEFDTLDSSNVPTGGFWLMTGYSTGYNILAGKPDGTLTWIGKDITGDVHTTGNETINGTKTFTNHVNLNGDVHICKNDNTTYLRLCGGSGSGNENGAKIALAGSNLSSEFTSMLIPNSFRIFTGKNTGTNITYDIYGKNDGTLTWNNKDITGDVHTTGDETIAGEKTFSGGITLAISSYIKKENNTSYLRLCGGSGSSANHGAKLALAGASLDASSTNQLTPGSFRLFTSATSSTGDYISLYGKTDGTLTWNAKDITGDVHKAGNETITGNKTFSGDIILSGDANICRPDKTGLARLCGGTGASYSTGAKFYAYGADNTTYGGNFFAATGGSSGKLFNGKPDGTLTWNGNAIQTTSDERLKTPLANVDDSILSAWEAVNWGEFKYLEAIEEKGEENTRLHIGLIAQQIINSFKKQNLDICKYGICCHDTSVNPETDEDNDLWMVRYTEALCMEAAYQRRQNSRMKATIEALEQRIALLEEKINQKG